MKAARTTGLGEFGSTDPADGDGFNFDFNEYVKMGDKDEDDENGFTNDMTEEDEEDYEDTEDDETEQETVQARPKSIKSGDRWMDREGRLWPLDATNNYGRAVNTMQKHRSKAPKGENEEEDPNGRKIGRKLVMWHRKSPKLTKDQLCFKFP
jgi:hypothetical protein